MTRERSMKMCAGYASGGMPKGPKIGPGRSPASRSSRMPKPLPAQPGIVPPIAAATPGIQPIARGGVAKRAGGGVVVGSKDFEKQGSKKDAPTKEGPRNFSGGFGVTSKVTGPAGATRRTEAQEDDEPYARGGMPKRKGC